MKPLALGIVANTSKQRVADVLPPLFKWLQEKDIPFVVAADLQVMLNLDGIRTLAPENVADESEIILSFGGDGTFLQTAHLIVPREVPIVGVNLGGFGYLADVKVEQLQRSIIDLCEGRYSLQERLMLEAICRHEGTEHRFDALNDVVIEKGGFSRTIRLETNLDGDYLNSFKADGLIIATPTGSTGYSLSVGGPIIEPTVSVLVVAPISPHMLANRPLVIEGERKVKITTFSESGYFQITVDGKRALRPDSGNSVEISVAPYRTRIVQFGGNSFYETLRNKLHWRAQADFEVGE